MCQSRPSCGSGGADCCKLPSSSVPTPHLRNASQVAAATRPFVLLQVKPLGPTQIGVRLCCHLAQSHCSSALRPKLPLPLASGIEALDDSTILIWLIYWLLLLVARSPVRSPAQPAELEPLSEHKSTAARSIHSA